MLFRRWRLGNPVGEMAHAGRLQVALASLKVRNRTHVRHRAFVAQRGVRGETRGDLAHRVLRHFMQFFELLELPLALFPTALLPRLLVFAFCIVRDLLRRGLVRERRLRERVPSVSSLRQCMQFQLLRDFEVASASIFVLSRRLDRELLREDLAVVRPVRLQQSMIPDLFSGDLLVSRSRVRAMRASFALLE